MSYPSEFRSQYSDPARDEALGELAAISFPVEEDRTEQHHCDECDLNLMLARLGVSPERGLPVVTVSNIVKDVTLLPDTLEEAFRVIEAGRQKFDELPAGVRAYFLNDPRRFLMASEDELIASGIPAREAEPVAPPAEAPVLEQSAT